MYCLDSRRTSQPPRASTLTQMDFIGCIHCTFRFVLKISRLPLDQEIPRFVCLSLPIALLRSTSVSHQLGAQTSVLTKHLSIFQAILLFAGVALSQESGENPNDQIRRLRFRRPRPKVVGVSDEEGVAQGRPIPLAAIPARNQGRSGSN